MSKNQLHRLLAVETEKKNTARVIVEETTNTFIKKHPHFEGHQRTYFKTLEDSDDFSPEIKEVVDTVKGKLDHTIKALVPALDVLISKEETNASGNVHAMLSVDGIEFGELSATSLLQLETQLKAVRKLYISIPTLDPVKVWTKNEDTELYESDKEVTYKTIKKEEPLVLYAATKEHPAQTKIMSVDKQAGKWEKYLKSGKIKPIVKSILIERIDILINAVKDARALANQAEVVQVKVGQKLFDFINKDII